MGFFSEEMLPMLDTFEAETADLMDSFDAVVARGEKSNTFSSDDIAELFRATHTIKSSSAMMGLDDLSKLTHHMEDLFGLLRNNPSLVDGHVDDMLDDLYAFSDFIKDELGRMNDEDFKPSSGDTLFDAITADIEHFGGSVGDGDAAPGAAPGGAAPGETSSGETASGGAAPGETAPDGTAIPAGTVQEDSRSTVSLRIRFNPDTAMPNARAFVITKQLSAHCRIVSYVPHDLTNHSSSETIQKHGFVITVPTDEQDVARVHLAKNAYIDRIEVLEPSFAAAYPPKEVSATTPGATTPAAAPAAASSTRTKGTDENNFVSLHWSDIHNLQDLTGEFLIKMAALRVATADFMQEKDVYEAVSNIGHLVNDLNYHIESLAMLRISTLVPQLSRLVRDMCRTLNKSISFEVEGEHIEIDRNLYNSISEPLIHIIRNAVDHGIEPSDERLAKGKSARGKITLTVENQGAHVAFCVTDDGRGMDYHKIVAKAAEKGMLDKAPEDYSPREALELIMKPGFSTSTNVTHYSGRGVGMDVVRTVVMNFGGHIDIESTCDVGTRIELFMPVSVTSIVCLGFYIGPYTCFLPLFNLKRVYSASEISDLITQCDGRTWFTYKKTKMPVLDMHKLFCCEGHNDYYIACHSIDKDFVITTDRVIGELMCANKHLPACLDQQWQQSCGIRNGVILPSGSVGFALNAALLCTLVYNQGDM